MDNLRVLRFGLGDLVCNFGTYEGYPCIFIEPALIPGGSVGEVEQRTDNEVDLRPGAVVLQFQKKEGIQIIIEDLQSAYKEETLER